MTEQTEEIAFPIAEAIDYKGRDRVVHFLDYLEQKTAANHGRKIFSCGFPAFDKAVGGLAAGEVVVITGHRKEGKTTFAESWLMSMASVDPEAHSLILSYEMPPEYLLEKWKSEPNAPVYLPLELETGNFDWIFRRCIEAKYKYNARIVLIDHLGFVVDMATKNFSVNVGAFMRRLKTEVALKHGLAIILLAHQTQPKEGQEASVDNLYGSVTIGQDSDATIVVMRKENLTKVELMDFIAKAGEEKSRLVIPPPDAGLDDNFSAGLAIVKVDCHRRTGYRRWKKLFRKVGDWMVEI
jgi:archaellum biogenesis ATPase FlaH